MPDIQFETPLFEFEFRSFKLSYTPTPRPVSSKFKNWREAPLTGVIRLLQVSPLLGKWLPPNETDNNNELPKMNAVDPEDE